MFVLILCIALFAVCPFSFVFCLLKAVECIVNKDELSKWKLYGFFYRLCQ